MARSLRVGALASLLLASSAVAQTPVGLAPLDGRGSGTMERLLERGLEQRGFSVVRLERAPEDDSDANVMAQDAGVDALVSGRVQTRGARRRQRVQVALEVRDASGRVEARIRTQVPARRAARIVARVAGALDAIPAAEPVAVQVSRTPDSSGEPARVEAPGDERHAEPSAATPIVQGELQVGAGLRTRVIELLTPDGLDAAYRAEPYFELTARAEARLFDIAFVRADFGSSVGLSSDREDPRLGTIDTWFARLQADAGAVGWIDETVALGGAIGVGWERYELAFNELVPTTEYVHVRPALLTSFRLIDRLLVLDAEGGVRFVLGVGDLESIHGRDHEILGADIRIRIHGTIPPGFTWALESGFHKYWLTFNRPDGVVSGSDGGWHLTAWAGWRL